MESFTPETGESFHINQRNEGIDLGGISGALMATQRDQMQTFVTQEVMCLNDQGGSFMNLSENRTGTLRSQMHSHQPLIYENHGIDSRYRESPEVTPTISARCGTGGNNAPFVVDEVTICIVGNTIDRKPENGGNGKGFCEDIAYTLTATDRHAVFSRQRVDVFRDNEVASTQSARQFRDATDLVCETSVFGQSRYRNYSDGCAALRAEGGYIGGESENLVMNENAPAAYLIRRLTPLECERLQGFPDNWTALPDATDSPRYKALGNSVAIPCVEYIMQGFKFALMQQKAACNETDCLDEYSI